MSLIMSCFYSMGRHERHADVRQVGDHATGGRRLAFGRSKTMVGVLQHMQLRQISQAFEHPRQQGWIGQRVAASLQKQHGLRQRVQALGAGASALVVPK